MRKLLWCALVGLVLAPSASVHACGDAQVLSTAAAGDYVNKTVTVEIKGKLTVLWMRCFGPPIMQVAASGTTYRLEFADDALRQQAVKLDGRTVQVHGTLQEQVVQVTSLLDAYPDYVQQVQSVKVRGKIAENVVPIDYPEIQPAFGTRIVWEVSANGKKYELNFGGHKELLGLAQRLRGRTVVLTGVLNEASFLEVPLWLAAKGPAVEFWPRPKPLLNVHSLTVEAGDAPDYVTETALSEMRGTVRRLESVVDPRVALITAPPGCKMLLTVGDEAYWVNLANTPYADRVAELDGKRVLLTGKVEVQSPPSQGARPVLVVQSLEVVE